MQQFNELEHTNLITTWWLNDPQLVTLLQKTRGYELPSDWIIDLRKNQLSFISQDGIIEIIDVLYGEKSKEANIFYYSINKQKEQELATNVIQWCFSKGIDKIRTKSLEIKDISIDKKALAYLEGLLKGVQNVQTTIYDGKNESTTSTTTAANTSKAGDTVILSTEGNSTTRTKDSSTSPADEKPITNTVCTEKPNSKGKAKQRKQNNSNKQLQSS